MTPKEIIEIIKDWGWLAIIILPTISYFLFPGLRDILNSALGNVLKSNREKTKALHKLAKKDDEIMKMIYENKVDAIRRHIIDFEQDIRNNVPKSAHQWEYVLNECAWYESEHKKDVHINGYAMQSIAYIRNKNKEMRFI